MELGDYTLIRISPQEWLDSIKLDSGNGLTRWMNKIPSFAREAVESFAMACFSEGVYMAMKSLPGVTNVEDAVSEAVESGTGEVRARKPGSVIGTVRGKA